MPKVLREQLLLSLWGGDSANGVGDEQIRSSHTGGTRSPQDSLEAAAIWKFCDGCWSFPMAKKPLSMDKITCLVFDFEG